LRGRRIDASAGDRSLELRDLRLLSGRERE